MGTEIELKLAAPRSALRQAMHARWLTKAAIDKPNGQRLTSIYFDTPDFALRDQGISLRVRKTGSANLQTIKASNGDIVRRNEWENRIDDDRPKLSLARNTALAPLLTNQIKRELGPVFETDVERTVVPLRIGNSEIEIAFDQGRINTPDDHDSISEIEIELKKGRRSDMVLLARRLARAFPVTYAARSKAERGYALLESTRDAPVSARPVQISPTMTTADAFDAIAFECLRQVAGNEVAVRRSDPEGVHQMRVGLRRLRAALSLFKHMLEGRETEAVKKDLVWLTDELGPARDYDVLVSESVAPALEQHPDRPELRLLESDFERARNKGHAQARSAVESPRYRRILLETALWVLDGEWRKNRDALATALRDRAVTTFVHDEIKRRSRKIIKNVRRLEELNARRRHKLRIAVKKMRYACDFFETPIARDAGAKAARTFKRALKDLQSGLGKLNDMAVHARLASDFVPSKATQKAFAIGYLVGQEAATSRRLLRDTAQAGKKMRRAAIF